ncbi:hypothetical protein PMIT1323_00390 [Prochlorococcus marinus str. MIT 1323]|nr:hypothetical protein PMIT1323_00390 [Prochlorococcus marinus str. MIT 1323]
MSIHSQTRQLKNHNHYGLGMRYRLIYYLKKEKYRLELLYFSPFLLITWLLLGPIEDSLIATKCRANPEHRNE